jgi:hypothetical protein
MAYEAFQIVFLILIDVKSVDLLLNLAESNRIMGLLNEGGSPNLNFLIEWFESVGNIFDCVLILSNRLRKVRNRVFLIKVMRVIDRLDVLKTGQ